MKSKEDRGEKQPFCVIGSSVDVIWRTFTSRALTKVLSSKLVKMESLQAGRVLLGVCLRARVASSVCSTMDD